MIVIFGGSFNPPTIAHYQIAKYILSHVSCDQFFFLPVGDQYPKKELIEAKHRVAMLEKVCTYLNNASVSTLEVDADTVLTTYQTLSLLKHQFPNQEIAFVIGADNLEELPTWVEYEKLITNFKLIVFRRDDIDVDQIINTQFERFKHRFIVLDAFSKMDVSSTKYRHNLNASDLVLTDVDQYVKANHLYGRGDKYVS